MKWFTSRVKRAFQRIIRTRKRILIPVTVVILALLSFGIYKFVDFYHYMEDDPQFCLSCHVMEESWDRWAISEHKDIGCHNCHQQSVIAGINQLISFTFGNFERVERHAQVPDDACEKCHESGSQKWIQVAATSGHKLHAEEENIACVKCHSVALHRFEPPGPICNVCHEDKHVEMEGMAAMHCTACHDYLVEEDENLVPLRSGCLECHQALAGAGITWPATAPMQYPCGDCHQPHLQAEPLVDCLSCHTPDGMHLMGAHGASSCITCHAPHSWVVSERETCLSCHPGQVEHNAGVLCGNCHSFTEQ